MTMAFQGLRLPLTTFPSFQTTYRTTIFSFPNLSASSSSVRWFRGQMHFPSRSFSVKSTKISQPKKDWMKYAWNRFQQYSRTFIQSWILQGNVYVDGKVVNKAGTPVSDKTVVEIIAEIPKYVCRAGYKLEAAIEQLGVDVTGKVALDSGLSTGGFTDYLLQFDAAYVYGVDVGYGQVPSHQPLFQQDGAVADKIRRDERVSVIERTNLRYLPGLPQKVMPAVVKVMKEQSTLVTLVKPQFEARRSQVGSGGIVRDQKVHKEVLERIIKGVVESCGFKSRGWIEWIESPLKVAKGNTEFLVCFDRIAEQAS